MNLIYTFVDGQALVQLKAQRRTSVTPMDEVVKIHEFFPSDTVQKLAEGE